MNKIIVRFHGGTANLLFQYAFYLKLQEDYPDATIQADISHVKQINSHNEKDFLRYINISIIDSFDSKNFSTIYEKDYNNFNGKKNNYFIGYWQYPKYFPSNMQPIFALFSSLKLHKKNTLCLKNIQNTNSISIHVRRGDYVNNYLHGNIANKVYYNNSIDYMNKKIENPHFFVFSDDIAWCKENLNITDNATFIDWNTKEVLIDISLMSNCKHNIISNSSFSWWAQFLNKNSSKLVLSPEYWYNQKLEIAIPPIENVITISNVPIVTQKSKNPFFTIIIPVYKTEQYVRRCLSTVLNQTFADFEAIFVDDASPDKAVEIIEEYAKNDARIHILSHKKNKGTLCARITGMKATNGSYILFLDSDDYFELNALEILHTELTNMPCDMLEFGYIHEPERLVIPPSYCEKNRAERLLSIKDSTPQTLWNKTYAKNLVQTAQRYIESIYLCYAEDIYLSIIFSFFSKSCSFTSATLLHYVSGIGITSTYTEQQIVSKSADINLSTELLVTFFNQVDKSYLVKISEYQKKVEMSLLHAINMLPSLSEKIDALVIFKKYVQTDYYKEFISRLEPWWNFGCLGKKQKIKKICAIIAKKLHLYTPAKKLSKIMKKN